MSVSDFERRLSEALSPFSNEGNNLPGAAAQSNCLKLEWSTVSEAKQLKSRLIQAQKQIRLIKKDVNALKKEIRATFAAETAKVGKTIGSEISKALVGKKATGKANARRKEQLRRDREKQLEPYDRVAHTLDQWLARLEQSKSEIDQWITNQTNTPEAIAFSASVQAATVPEPADSPKAQADEMSSPAPQAPPPTGQEQSSLPQTTQARSRVPGGVGILFALIFGLCALASLPSEFFDSVVFTGLALLCLPIFNQFLIDKGWRMKSRTKFAALMAGMLFVSCTQPPASINSTSGTQTASGSASTTTVMIAPSPATSPATATPSTPKPSAVAQAAPPDRTPAKVVSTGDGDTLRALVNGTPVTVRMACIDAPEAAQPQGQQAADRLRQLLPRDAQIELRTVDTDRYGRTVAEVYRNGQSVNLQMVAEGWAVVYNEYLDGCNSTRSDYLAAESTAKRQRRAFWSQSNPIMPWDWRQGRRPAPIASPAPVQTPPVQAPQPAASAAQNCDPSYPDLCIPPDSPDLDCGDISARGFRVVGGDPHRLDRDKDGIGCES
jgi:micrococcal nuclease